MHGALTSGKKVHVAGSGPAGSVSVTHVELRLAGRFRVVRDGTELADGEIGSRKSRTLLKLLAGAQAGEAAIRQVVTDAGFTRFRRAAETPFNLVYEVRP